MRKVTEGVKMGSRFCKLVNFKNNLAQMLSGKRGNVKFVPPPPAFIDNHGFSLIICSFPVLTNLKITNVD